MLNKIQMKKKHRRAVCKSLIWLIKPFWWLFYAIAAPFAVLLMLLSDWEDVLVTKFKVRSYDD